MHVISVVILLELHKKEICGGNILPTFEDSVVFLFIIFPRKKISDSLKCQIYTVRIKPGIPGVKYDLGWNLTYFRSRLLLQKLETTMKTEKAQ
jgi:hypothetical protein